MKYIQVQSDIQIKEKFDHLFLLDFYNFHELVFVYVENYHNVYVIHENIFDYIFLEFKSFTLFVFIITYDS